MLELTINYYKIASSFPRYLAIAPIPDTPALNSASEL